MAFLFHFLFSPPEVNGAESFDMLQAKPSEAHLFINSINTLSGVCVFPHEHMCFLNKTNGSFCQKYWSSIPLRGGGGKHWWKYSICLFISCQALLGSVPTHTGCLAWSLITFMENRAGDYLGREISVLTKHTVLLVFIQEKKIGLPLPYLNTATWLMKKKMQFTVMLEGEEWSWKPVWKKNEHISVSPKAQSICLELFYFYSFHNNLALPLDSHLELFDLFSWKRQNLVSC